MEKCDNFRYWLEALLPECAECTRPIPDCPAKKLIKYYLEYYDKYVSEKKGEK
jgi:hypothetical protein